MSVICLICKEKLLNNSPGSPLGSLNSLIENQAIATGCGHLYHFECLQCWFRTQKKKLQNQGITGNFPDHCPTCQTEVRDEQIRRIYLLEDHRESLERAKLLERLENLEIHCHQLENHVHQLQRENDLLLDKALTPSSSSRKDHFAAIVKNDKVMWLKKDSTPLSGVVQTIFKKDGSLWVKIKLDKKIRTNSRTGLFGSFRFDKNKEVTVPFEEIVLERDFKKNNIIHGSGTLSEPTTPTAISLQKVPSFRSSTLSLPGEYARHFSFSHGSHGMRPVSSYDIMHNYGSTFELSNPSIAEVPEDNSYLSSQHHPQAPQQPQAIVSEANNAPNSGSRSPVPATIIIDRPAEETPGDNSNEMPMSDNKSLSEQREYVLFTPPRSPKLNGRSNAELFASSPQLNDIKTKHVTFADDLLLVKRLSMVSMSQKGNHFRDHGYNNVIEMSGNLDMQGPSSDAVHQIDSRSRQEAEREMPEAITEDLTVKSGQNQFRDRDSLNLPHINLIEPSTSSTPSPTQSSPSGLAELQNDVFIDSFNQTSKAVSDLNYNRSCFDITFSMLFYQCKVFDKLLLMRNSASDDIQRLVQQILATEFVGPLRDSRRRHYTVGYSDRLHEAISHLCSTYLDLEELMTILFEYVFKIPPFIGYSFDMCDYIHQFFIDFTDKQRTPTVQQLLDRSLLLQDNLKLRQEPKPALFLQMPNSEDGILIHYNAVLPSLTLNIENLLEEDAIKCEALSCYCNKTATLECATCAKIHGKSPVLFCEDCSVLLEAIHDQLYHKLELVPLVALNNSSSALALSGVICLKDSAYSVFLRDPGNDAETESKWLFIESFRDGRPQITELPKLDNWIESICSDSVELEMKSLDKFQRKLLTECRMFFYLPMRNSFA